jgi:hypothetical protein
MGAIVVWLEGYVQYSSCILTSVSVRLSSLPVVTLIDPIQGKQTVISETRPCVCIGDKVEPVGVCVVPHSVLRSAVTIIIPVVLCVAESEYANSPVATSPSVFARVGDPLYPSKLYKMGCTYNQLHTHLYTSADIPLSQQASRSASRSIPTNFST